MMATDLEKLYQEHLKPLSPADRLRLIERLAQSLITPESSKQQPPKRSLMKLPGLGKEIREGVGAQEHINRLREE